MSTKEKVVDQKYPSDAADRFQLRMPNGMRERIAHAADQNGRSMNSEILARIEATFSGEPTPGPQLDAFVETFGRKMVDVFERSLYKTLLGREAQPSELSGLGLLEWLKNRHILESAIGADLVIRDGDQMMVVEAKTVEPAQLAEKDRAITKKGVRQNAKHHEATRGKPK